MRNEIHMKNYLLILIRISVFRIRTNFCQVCDSYLDLALYRYHLRPGTSMCRSGNGITGVFYDRNVFYHEALNSLCLYT
jgi:hypothetical protein